MSKRNGGTRPATRRGASATLASVNRLRNRATARPRSRTSAVADDNARREFVKRVAAAAAFGLTGFPAGTFAAADAADLRAAPVKRRKTRVTLFFNLSHLGGADTTHYLYMGGSKHKLERVENRPQVLRHERRRNAFLRAVDDDQITHHVRNVGVATDAVTLAYLACNENPANGTWEMTSMHLHIPLRATGYAYAQARALTPQGPLPRSGKRLFYDVPAAMTQSDLEDELALVDVNSHAEALVGLHPDLLSIEPSSAAHIQSNYVSQDSNTQFLASLLETLGPAVPEGKTNVSGMPPWATLMPLVDDKTGQSYKKSDGKLNQYYPDWSPQVEQNMAPAVASVHPLVKNDATLGVNVTGFNLNDPTHPIPPEQVAGSKWAVHDGIPTVVRLAGAASADHPKVAFTNRGAETGLYVTQPDHGTLSDGRVQVTLDNVSNWFLRYLGMWVQFLDPNGMVIPANKLPNDTFPAEPGPYPRALSLDKSDALFLGIVSPAVAVCAIPVYPGSFSPTLNIPLGAQTMRIFYGGLGQSGSIPADPAGIIGVGIGMTAAFNYGVVGLFLAAGASTFPSIFKLVIALGGGSVAAEVMALIGSIINQANGLRELLAVSMGFLKIFFQVGLSKVITAIAEAIAAELVAAEFIDSIPVAGQIARAAAAVIGAAQLAETSIEVGISPAVYTFEIVQTHDLSVTILPDPMDTQFPAPPSRDYTLYYRVSYLFDNGTAHTLDAVTVPDPTVKSIPIVFTAIPRGGKVNISIGFYMRHSSTPPGQNDWCAGFATTGLIDNNVDTAPDTAITEVNIPIQHATRYVHTRKTALDSAGNHVWLATANAPPYVPPPGGQQPGLGDFDGITVRQGTSSPPRQGYVGYAWKAFSSGVNGCGGPAPGQFDQMANLNTDAGNGGRNAQSGYTNTASLCGYPPGVRMGYNLLTQNTLNVYLDTTSLLIRQVNLDPPGFASPGSNQSFGRLNMDSTRCMLHPAGHIVSISNANHKLEVLKLPVTPVADSVAAQFFLARTLSGPGFLPGLVLSPAALGIAPDGAILVLEEGNNRIQAFDLGGNSVPFFKQQPDPHFLELPATTGATYLDLAVEFTGYLYVLSKDADNRHRLDIYHPSQTSTTPICTTLDVNAAKLTVDFWRRAYMLNYEVLQLPGGGIPAFTEPSVSLWLPIPPRHRLRA